jgi:hypothetical protein
MGTDTPMPQEEPYGENPPDGAIINYFLKDSIDSEVHLEVRDAAGKLVLSFSSNDKPYEGPAVNIPLYWIRPQQILSGAKGSHRFVWDLHYTPLNEAPEYPIAATYKNTAPTPTSPWVLPGNYTVSFTAKGKTLTQPLQILMDPRVRMTQEQLKRQYELSMECYEGKIQLAKILKEAERVRTTLRELIPKAQDKALAALKEAEQALTVLEGTSRGQDVSLKSVQNALETIFGILQEADMPVTSQTEQAVVQTRTNLLKITAAWTTFTTDTLEKLSIESLKLRSR